MIFDYAVVRQPYGFEQYIRIRFERKNLNYGDRMEGLFDRSAIGYWYLVIPRTGAMKRFDRDLGPTHPIVSSFSMNGLEEVVDAHSTTQTCILSGYGEVELKFDASTNLAVINSGKIPQAGWFKVRVYKDGQLKAALSIDELNSRFRIPE